MTTVPTIQLDHLSEAQVRALVIADNKLAELAGWDRDLLAIKLQELAELDLGFDLEVTGLETAEIDLLIGTASKDHDPDPADTLPAIDPETPVVSRPGDLWVIGPHRLLCANALEQSSYPSPLPEEAGARAGGVGLPRGRVALGAASFPLSHALPNTLLAMCCACRTTSPARQKTSGTLGRRRMPWLPLDHPEPFAATLGVMLYPGKDESERKQARAFAAQFLGEPIRLLHESGGSLRYEDLTRIASDAGARLSDLEDRWWKGTATGELVKMLFALAHSEPALASWSHATELVERSAARHRVPGSRSVLYAARSTFRPVAHLWGAWCIRERRFQSDPDVGYESWHDFQFFLAEAEILYRCLRSELRGERGGEPVLPDEAWRVPEGWQPPERQPNWPRTGVVPRLTVPEDALAGLRGPGRPRKPR